MWDRIPGAERCCLQLGGAMRMSCSGAWRRSQTAVHPSEQEGRQRAWDAENSVQSLLSKERKENYPKDDRKLRKWVVGSCFLPMRKAPGC